MTKLLEVAVVLFLTGCGVWSLYEVWREEKRVCIAYANDADKELAPPEATVFILSGDRLWRGDGGYWVVPR